MCGIERIQKLLIRGLFEMSVQNFKSSGLIPQNATRNAAEA